MKAIEMIAVPDDASEPMTLEAVIDAITNFMGMRAFGPAKWQAMRSGEHGPSPKDSVWHGEYGQFDSEVVRPFVIGLSVVGASGFVRLVEDDGSTCIIDGRSLASDEFEKMVGDWSEPPDLWDFPNPDATAGTDFRRWASGSNTSRYEVHADTQPETRDLDPIASPEGAQAPKLASEEQQASKRGRPNYNSVRHAIVATFVRSDLGEGKLSRKELRDAVNKILGQAFTMNDRKNLFLESGNKSEDGVLNFVLDLVPKLEAADIEMTESRPRHSQQGN